MEIVTILVSIVSMVVVASVTSYTMAESNRLKRDVNTTFQSVVDQINNAQYYKYKFDKLQESNIKTLDTNTQNMHERMASLRQDVHATRTELEKQAKSLENKFVAKTDLASGVEYIKTGKLRLGDQHILSGVGDAHNKQPDGWLRFFGKDGKDYYGGIAAGKIWSRDGAILNGNVDVNGTLNVRGAKSDFNPKNLTTQFAKDNRNYIRGDTEIHGNTLHLGHMNIQQSASVRGGASEYNPSKLPTVFANPKDQRNFVRGDTEIQGNTNNLGNLNVGRHVNVQGKLFFGDASMNPKPVAANSTDPYFLEKVAIANDRNALRLTINDNPDEAFEIWGNACGTAAGCQGGGALQHYFRANGDTQHMGNMQIAKNLCIGNTCINETELKKVKTLLR